MNQMTAAGSISFTYDSNGNTATKTENQATTTYTWDYENRLTEIDNPSGDDYVYEYDGDGMRVRAGHDSGQGTVWDTRFYYDVGAPLYSYLFEADNAQTMTVAYTADALGNLISQRRGEATSYYFTDRLGSARVLLDPAQTVTDTYSYYAFGGARSSSGTTMNPFRFLARLGHYQDASTQSQYVRARDYSPGDGRFLSADRGKETRVPAYRYCANGPTWTVDPSGHQWIPRGWCRLPWWYPGPGPAINWWLWAFREDPYHPPLPPGQLPGGGPPPGANPCAKLDPQGRFCADQSWCQECAAWIAEALLHVPGGALVVQRINATLQQIHHDCEANPARTPRWMMDQWRGGLGPNWGDVWDIVSNLLPMV